MATTYGMRRPLAAFTAAMFAFAVMFASAGTASATTPETEAASAAVDYIESLQNTDGGFPAFGTDSSPGSTLDAVFALSSVGQDPTAVTTGGNSPADYLATQASSYASDPGAAAKLSLGVSVMGLDPSNFGGEDLLDIMDQAFDSGTGSYGLDLFDEAFYLLALSREGEPVSASAVPYVLSLQQPDGGWEFASGAGSDSNTTAIVLQALIAAGLDVLHAGVVDGLAYLQSLQNSDGGFGFTAGSDSDPNSTAFVIQSLAATKQRIKAGEKWTTGGNTPLDGLLSFRNETTGAFQFFGEDSAFATYQAVPALMLAPFPGLTTQPVGGVAELPELGPAPAKASTGSRFDYGFIALASGGLLAVVALGSVAWHARRRSAR